MMSHGHFAFYRVRPAITVLVVLPMYALPTIAQTAGFDEFTQPVVPGSVISAGPAYTIKWTASSPAGQISLILLEGASNRALQLGPSLASTIYVT